MALVTWALAGVAGTVPNAWAMGFVVEGIPAGARNRLTGGSSRFSVLVTSYWILLIETLASDCLPKPERAGTCICRLMVWGGVWIGMLNPQVLGACDVSQMRGRLLDAQS